MKPYNAPFYSEEDLSVLDTDDLKYPYSDNYMVYIGKEHQYELTAKLFEERGHNLQVEVSGNAPDKVKIFLADLRRKVYQFIYTHCALNSQDKLNFLIAKRGLRRVEIADFRRQFMEAMFLEGEYLLTNGDLSKASGVDLDTMQNMSADVMRVQNRDWDVHAIDTLKSIGLVCYVQYKFQTEKEGW